jgi:putative ABC transport system permease protein
VIAEILVLEGFLAGLYEQLRSAVLNRGGDVIVSQAGISNFLAARSILPQLTSLDVEEVDGVKTAHPVTALSVIYDRDGRKMPIIILVYDTAGGPTEIVSGRSVEADREIVIDQGLSRKFGLGPGDPIMISDFEFRISGVSGASAAFFTPFAFIKYDDLIDFYLESEVAADIATFPLLSFLLVDVESGADPPVVAAAIERQIAVADTFLPTELAGRDEELGRELMGPILGLLIIVSYGTGALVVGMFMFAAIKARVRSLGVMRALGFRPQMLSLAVVAEAGLLTLLALPVGIFLSLVLARIIHELSPVYLILPVEPEAIIRTAVICLVMACIGALAPVRMIARLEPAAVFRN